MTNGGINIKLYKELYARSRAILKRENVEAYSVGDLLIEGIVGGGLWVYFDDEVRGARLIMDCDKDGNISNRMLSDVKILDDALTTLRAHTVLEDLSEIE